MKTLFKITLFCLLFTPINAFAQFKHDLGIKGTNLDTERLQLEYRLHKNENWAFTGTFGYAGSGYRTSYAEGLLPRDTTIKRSIICIKDHFIHFQWGLTEVLFYEAQLLLCRSNNRCAI